VRLAEPPSVVMQAAPGMPPLDPWRH
jgi:hypothetical protein